MNILVITPELPWPPETGGKASQFACLRALRNDHSFRIVVTRANPQLDSLASALEAELPHVRVIRDPSSRNLMHQETRARPWRDRIVVRLRRILRAWRSERGQEPQQSRECIRPYYPFVPLSSESLQAISAHVDWADLLQGEFHESLYIAFLQTPNLPKVFICHQAHGRFCQRFYDSLAAPEILAQTDTAAAAAMEIQCMSRFSHVITFTQEDRDYLLNQDKTLPISVSPFPVPADCQIVSPAEVGTWTLNLIYIGSGMWYPNVQAVRWFCDHVYPLLRLRLPAEACRLNVIGNWPEPVRQSFPDTQVHFRGFASEMAAAMSGNISINPVFTGAGLRTKLLAAAACSSPMVTTSIGCEGLGLHHGIHLLVADAAEEFAAAIVSLIRNRPMAAQLAEHAFTHVMKTFGPEAVRIKRNQIYEQVCQEFARHS